MDWIINNLATVVVGMILLAAVITAVCKLIKDRKHGGCGNGCSGCSACRKMPSSQMMKK
ncbi:MAG: FeoB-associated Cys-rich membrane protein [Firmicutes bacterium]|nr:FeoB-associated Cys-rich membrane protein [Bacillota bacterium]